MNIMNIQFAPNNYMEITNGRYDVIKAICEAFLADNVWSVFHPNSDGNGAYRGWSNYVLISHGKGCGFHSKPQGNKSVRIHKCEVEFAVKILLKHGYHLYHFKQYDTWDSYIVHRSPRLAHDEVTKINGWSGHFL